MHPHLARFIAYAEKEAVAKGQYRHTIGGNERIFLESVWGPAFDWHFDGLHAEYPFIDFKGGQRFIDFVYVKGGVRLVIEVDGYTTHARGLSRRAFRDHQRRQNDLVLSRWIVLRFSVDEIKEAPAICQRQLLQAIGMWWSTEYGGFLGTRSDLWEQRIRLLVQLAHRQEGKLRIADVEKAFSIPRRTARNWINRLVDDGLLRRVAINQRVHFYEPV